VRNFVEIAQTVAVICQFLFFKMAAAAILHFRIFKFLTVVAVERFVLRHLAKFRQNRRTAAEMWRFFNVFKMAAVRHLAFVMRVFNVWGPPTKGIWWSLSLCKIWLDLGIDAVV